MRYVDTWQVCSDCFQAVAAGAGDGTPDRVVRALEDVARDGLHLSPDGGVTDFSWNPCEMCSDTDGGARFDVSVLEAD